MPFFERATIKAPDSLPLLNLHLKVAITPSTEETSEPEHNQIGARSSRQSSLKLPLEEFKIIHLWISRFPVRGYRRAKGRIHDLNSE